MPRVGDTPAFLMPIRCRWRPPFIYTVMMIAGGVRGKKKEPAFFYIYNEIHITDAGMNSYGDQQQPGKSRKEECVFFGENQIENSKSSLF